MRSCSHPRAAVEAFPAFRQHSEPVRPVNAGNKQANTPSSSATTELSTFFSFRSQYRPPGGGISIFFFFFSPMILWRFHSRWNIFPGVLSPPSPPEVLGPVWSSRRLSGSLSGSLLASVKSPFLRSSCRLTMGYCCSGCSSDARHLWRENSSVVTEGKYSSLGPERNHMCLVFNQPVWVLRSSRKAFSQMWSACFVSFGAEPRPALLTGVCRRHLATNKPPPVCSAWTRQHAGPAPPASVS